MKWILDRRGCYREDIAEMIDPFPQAPVSKQIPVEKRYQTRQRPTELGLEAEVLDQHGDQCCPNLDEQRSHRFTSLLWLTVFCRN